MNLVSVLEEMRRAVIVAGAKVFGESPEILHNPEKDLVTRQDIESEKKMREVLNRSYPGVPTYSEELGGAASTMGFLWVLDGIDGSFNYALGHPEYGVSAGLVSDGQSVAGAICYPALGLVAEATSRTAAVYREFRGSASPKSLLVRQDIQKLSDIAAKGTVWIDWVKEENEGRDMEAVIKIMRALQKKGLEPQIRNSCTTTMLRIALGQVAGFVYLRPTPFDIAASALIVEQAGGKVTDIAGSRRRGPFDPEGILASNGLIHNELVDLVGTSLGS